MASVDLQTDGQVPDGQLEQIGWFKLWIGLIADRFTHGREELPESHRVPWLGSSSVTGVSPLPFSVVWKNQ